MRAAPRLALLAAFEGRDGVAGLAEERNRKSLLRSALCLLWLFAGRLPVVIASEGAEQRSLAVGALARL
ncbi:MAG: hypothetical protein WBA53_11040, partial [Burkholderiaceae bacterium]